MCVNSVKRLSLDTQIASDFKSNPLAIWNHSDSNHCDFSCDFYTLLHSFRGNLVEISLALCHVKLLRFNLRFGYLRFCMEQYWSFCLEQYVMCFSLARLRLHMFEMQQDHAAGCPANRAWLYENTPPLVLLFLGVFCFLGNCLAVDFL